MATRKKAKMKTPSTIDRESAFKTYRSLKNQIEKTWKQLRAAYLKRNNHKQIAKKRCEMLLLLGECDYMKRELKKAQ